MLQFGSGAIQAYLESTAWTRKVRLLLGSSHPNLYFSLVPSLCILSTSRIFTNLRPI